MLASYYSLKVQGLYHGTSEDGVCVRVVSLRDVQMAFQGQNILMEYVVAFSDWIKGERKNSESRL